MCFNPRPSVRGDRQRKSQTIFTGRFQSTPLREGRLTHLRVRDRQRQFQSTPLREGRQVIRVSIYDEKIFQSTPLREGRRGLPAAAGLVRQISIHAPP